MASTLYTNASATTPGTVVVAAWLNDADTSTYNHLSAVAGTNTITATGPVSLTTITTGQKFFFIPQNTNTGATTLNISGLGAKAITKHGTTALVAGDLVANAEAFVCYDGTQFQLLNPQVAAIANGGTGATTASGARTNLGAGTTGDSLFTSATPSAALAVLGISSQPTMRNRIMNGDHTVIQFSNVATAPAAPYIIDQWMAEAADGTYSGALVASAGLDSFPNFLRLNSGAANAVNAGSFWSLTQRIEGIHIIDLEWGTARAKTITLSFWFRPSITGTYSVSLGNSGGARSYVATFTGTAATWEYKTLTIPGDTSGTWNNSNGVGVAVRFCAGVGSTFGTATANSWLAGNFVGTTTQVDLPATNGATFDIAGVQFERGSVATSFEHRLYASELQMLQRYYEVGGGRMDVVATAGGHQWLVGVPYKVQKRVSAPTILYSPITNSNCSTFDFLGGDQFYVFQRLVSTAAGGCIWQGTFSSDARL